MAGTPTCQPSSTGPSHWRRPSGRCRSRRTRYSGLADLAIDFEVNDQALTDEALVFPDSSGPPLTEEGIEELVRAAFTVSDGRAVASFLLFPADTTYTVSDGFIEYGVGLSAGVTGVPQPTPLLLFGIGGLVAFTASLRRVLTRARPRGPGAPKHNRPCNRSPLARPE
jgi:hypothetical protein